MDFSVEPHALGPLRVIGLSSTPAPCPMGTAASDLVLTIYGDGGGLTDVDVVVEDCHADVVRTLPLRGTLASDERWIVDSALGQILRLNTTTQESVSAFEDWDRTTLTPANDFPVLRPQDAMYEAGEWPSITLVVVGSGTAVGVATYREQYK